MGAHSTFIEDLITDEIRRLVAEAIQDGGALSVAECVEAVTKVYPKTGLSRRYIADEVIMAGAKAGVAIEIGRVRHSELSRDRKLS